MKTVVRQAFVGIGSNLGDRAATITEATERLRHSPGIYAVESSSIYESVPIGDTDQPMFLNAVLGIETSLDPEELLQILVGIESEFGRVRLTRWGARTLDLDLLAYEDDARSSPSLELPHPRMWERAFVVAPLRELMVHPLFQKRVWDSIRKRSELYISLEGVRPFPIDEGSKRGL